MSKSLTLIIVLFILVVSLIIAVFKLQRNLAFHKLQEEELDEYASEVETVYRQLRGIRHDYRNHLQVMSAYLDKKQTDELHVYLLELTNELNQVDTIIRTGNTLIDALVNTKLTRAQSQGVILSASAIAPVDIGIDKVDLAILLGNLLNNALEATEKDTNEKFIRLYIAPMKGNLYISITNSMTVNPHSNLFSLKAPNRQGYGLRRINQVVDKYGGILNRQWEDGVFATEVTLPLNSKEAVP